MLHNYFTLLPYSVILLHYCKHHIPLLGIDGCMLKLSCWVFCLNVYVVPVAVLRYDSVEAVWQYHQRPGYYNYPVTIDSTNVNF